jgi:hypothetical protein
VSARRSFQGPGFQLKIFRTFSFFTEVTRITRNWNVYLRRCSFLILTLINGEEKLPNYFAGTTEQVGMGTKNVIASVFSVVSCCLYFIVELINFVLMK